MIDKDSTLKGQAVKGIIWSTLERFSVQGITFILQIILARILLPSDYGIIGMLAVFLQIAQVFVDSGFGNALIKKMDCIDRDYSTVFIYNLFVSIFIYILLFLLAPLVSIFYSEPKLVSVMRVLALVLIINALAIVHKTKLVKDIDFKTQTKVSVLSSIVSGIVGIIAAYRGLGVWALCIQQLLHSILSFFLLLLYVKWFPKLIFDKKSFLYLFSFGSKLLSASLISVLYKNLYTLVIGKVFTARELGFFSRAESIVVFPSNNLALIISRVTYPVFSRIQNDNAKLRNSYKLVIKASSFIVFPLMLGLMIVTKPFVEVVLTDKWIEMVPIMQILCLDWMFDHLCVLNLNVLYVKGRTDLVLKLEILKKTIALLILFGSIPFGLIGMCWGRVIYTLIAVFINAYYTKKFLRYSIFEQLKDIIPFLMVAGLMCFIIFSMTSCIDDCLIKLSASIFIGLVSYSLMSLIFFKSLLLDIKLMFSRTNN